MEQVGLRLTGDVSDLQRSLQQGSRQLQDFARGAERDLGRVGGAAESAGKQALTLNHVLGLFTAREIGRFGWRALTGELSQFESAMVDAQTTAQKLRNTLSFAVGRDGAGRDMAFLRETAHALGLEFNSTAQQYARLAASARGTNMEGQGTRDLFLSIAQAATVMGMSVDETEGAFRAVQQMMSKGKVQAEELRGQLGERLPGAFQIAARAMGVTTGQLDKMLEQGQVFADDFLPKFAAQIKKELGGSVADATNSAQAATNRYTNAYNSLKQALADAGIYDLVAARQKRAAESFDETAEAIRRAKQEGHGLFVSLAKGFGTDIHLRNPFTGISMSARENAEELVIARKRLQELQAQSEVLGNNIYWKAERAEVIEYIARLEEALGKKKQLTEGFLSPEEVAERYSQYGGRGRGFEREERRQAAGRASVAGLRNKALGIDESYLNQLNELERLEREGFLSFDDRRSIAQKLTKDQFKKPADKHNPADGVFRSISERTAELRAEQQAQEDLTSAQKFASKVLDDLRTGSLKLSEAEKIRMGGALQALLVEDKANTEREKAKKLQEENTKIIEKNTEAASKAAEAAHRRVEQEIKTNEQLREEVATMGLDEEARTRRLVLLEEEHIKRLELDLIQAKNVEGNEAEIAALEREIAVRRQRLELLGQKADGERIKKFKDEWDKVVDDIGENLSDALMRGFEDGKTFAQNFRDTLKNAFKTLVLQPTIKAILVGPGGAGGMAGAFSSAMGTFGGGSGGGILGGLGSMFGFPSADDFSLSLTGGAGMFGQAAGATLNNGLINGFGQNMSNIGTLLEGGEWMGAAGAAMPYVGIGVALAQKKYGAAAGAAIGSIFGPIGTLVGGVIGSIVDGSGSKGGPKVESGAGFGVAQRGDPSAAMAQVRAIQQSYARMVASLGGVDRGLDVGVYSAQDPRGTAQTILDVDAALGGSKIYDRQDRFRTVENVGRSPEELQAAMSEEAQRVLLAALQHSDVPGLLGEWLRAVGDAATMGAQRVTEALAQLEKASAEKKGLEETWLDLTSTEEERLARQRKREIEALDVTNRAMGARVLALQDEIDAQNRAKAVYAEVTAMIAQVKLNLGGYVDRLNATPAGMLSPGEQLANAKSQFAIQLAMAKAGDRNALQNITQYADQLITAQRGYTASSPATQDTISYVKQSLAELPALLDAEKMVAEAVGASGAILNATLQELIARADANSAAEIAAYTQQAKDSIAATAAKAAVDDAAERADLIQGLIAKTQEGGLFSPGRLAARLRLRELGVPGYAGGGDHAGGWRWVGEDGPELEFTGPSRIFSAEQSARMVVNGSDGEVVRALARVEQRLDDLIYVSQAGHGRTVAGLDQVAANTEAAADAVRLQRTAAPVGRVT